MIDIKKIIHNIFYGKADLRKEIERLNKLHESNIIQAAEKYRIDIGKKNAEIRSLELQNNLLEGSKDLKI